MATASVSVKQLDDITECPICNEIYKDPRFLPCIHTYCFKCIEQWGREKIQDGKLACPLCRKEIRITKDGLAQLPKNFFVGKLLEVRNSASNLSSSLNETGVTCDVCIKRKPRKYKRRVDAVVYCVECRQNMCKNCRISHEQSRFQTRHDVVDIREQQKIEESIFHGIKFPESPCPKHPEKSQEVYCYDCKLVLCVMCYIADHSKHQCADVKQVAEEMTRQMEADADGFSGKVAECNELLRELWQRSKVFVENTNKVKKEIEQKAEELKRLIDDYKLKLLKDLNSERKQQEKEVESVRDELERRLVRMESFKKYSEELRSKGACDIATTATGLHDRALELMQSDVRSDIQMERFKVDVRFKSTGSGGTAAELNSLFGELLVNENEPKKLTAVQDAERATSSFKQFGTIAGNGIGVSGLTSLGDEVFVIRGGSTCVEVYNSSSLMCVRRLSLGWNHQPVADRIFLAACGVNNCIYVSGNYNMDNVYRVELRGSGRVSSWSVDSTPFGLSLNSDNNLLVVCGNQIKIYTTHGQQLNEITLQEDLLMAVNVIQLSNSLFGIITNTDPCYIGQQGFCVVDMNGQVTRSFNGSEYQTVGRLNRPSSVSLYQRDSVFIADCNNHRILVLNLMTFTAEPLALEGALRCPYCIHYDKSRGRLYVGEYDGQFRVVAYQK